LDLSEAKKDDVVKNKFDQIKKEIQKKRNLRNMS
jgi:hypothetical protein